MRGKIPRNLRRGGKREGGRDDVFAFLKTDGFQGKVLPEDEIQRQMALEDYARQDSIYHPFTDLCVMAPDGRFVAGCEALIDARNVRRTVRALEVIEVTGRPFSEQRAN